MTGWPWPLDGIQWWFDGLVNTITQALAPVIQAVTDAVLPVIRDVSTAVWNALPDWIQNAFLFIKDLAGQAWTSLWNFIKDPIGSIQGGLNWIVSAVSNSFSGLWNWLVQTFRYWGAQTLGAVSNLWTSISASIGGLGSYITDGLTRLFNDVSAGLGSVTTTISGAFTGALSTFGGWVTDAMAAVAGALGNALQGMITWLSAEIPKAVTVVVQFAQAYIIDPIVGAMQWVFARLTGIVRGLISTIEGLFAHHSPITPEQALPIGIGVLIAAVGAGALATGLADVLSTKVLGTGLDLKALGTYITGVINPSMFMGAVLGVIVGVGIKTPLTQFYNRSFRPSIPAIAEAQRMLWRGKITMGQFRDIVARWGYGSPYEDGFIELTKQLPGPGDLIRFVVREVIKPGIFDQFMVMQGFSITIAGWFWEAHWILPGRAEIVDAFHRGVITGAERNTYMVLHDFNPKPRPGIGISDQSIVSKIAKRLIPRVDLRRGYRIGRLSKAELDKRYGWLGYEEDTKVMTDIQVGLAFEPERNKLRDNARADLVKGYITVAILKADLAVLDYSSEAISYFVADARADRERKQKDALVDLYVDGYMKDLITEAELRDHLTLIFADPEAMDLEIEKAFTRKYRKPKPPKAATPSKAEKELQKLRVALAAAEYRKYIIDKAALRADLIAAGLDPGVAAARADYEEVKRPIRKPSDTEIARLQEQRRIRTTEERIIVEEYRKDRISAEVAVENLMALGLSEVLATAIVQLEYLKALTKPKVE